MIHDLWAAMPSWLRIAISVGAITFGGACAALLFVYIYALMWVVFGV